MKFIINFKRVLGFGGKIEKEKIQAEKAVITNQFSTFQLIVVITARPRQIQAFRSRHSLTGRVSPVKSEQEEK